VIPPHVQAQIDAGFALAEAQLALLRVLEARQLQLWMRQTLREMHKSPYLKAGEWELMLETYRACFPEAR